MANPVKSAPQLVYKLDKGRIYTGDQIHGGIGRVSGGDILPTILIACPNTIIQQVNLIRAFQTIKANTFKELFMAAPDGVVSHLGQRFPDNIRTKLFIERQKFGSDDMPPIICKAGLLRRLDRRFNHSHLDPQWRQREPLADWIGGIENHLGFLYILNSGSAIVKNRANWRPKTSSPPRCR